MKKLLCQKLKWSFLPLAFLVFGLFGLGIESAKADMAFSSSGYVYVDGSFINISGVDDEENNVLLCLSNEDYYGSTSSGCSFSLGLATSSSAGFIKNFHPSDESSGVSISYLFGVENGTFDWSPNVGYGATALECFIVEGVDTNNPVSVVASSTKLGYDGSSNYMLNGTYDYNPVAIMSTLDSWSGHYVLMNPNEDSFVSTSRSNNRGSRFSIMQLTSTSTEDALYDFYSNYQYAWAGLGILNLEPSSSEPEVYLISETQDLYLQFNPLLNFCPTNTSCLLNYIYDTALFSNPADFLKVWYYETSTSTPTYLGVQPLATKWEFDILGSGYLIASSTTSTDQFSYYRVQPCQFNYPYSCAGTSTVAVKFIEQTDPIEELENILTAPGNENITQNQGGIITINPKEIACTEEEWNTPDPVIGIDWLNATTSLPALNFTKHVCNIKAGLIAIPIATGNVFKDFWKKTSDYVSKIFPFGIIKNISNSWTKSASSTLPVALEWIVPIDEEGNITMTIPASMLKQATSSEIVIFGPDLADSNSSWTEFATKIRGITTYLLWAGFLWGLYLFGIKVYNEIRE